MNKSAVLIVMLFAAFSSGRLAAQDDSLGLGIILGEPTGISLKYWTGGRTAIDGGVAWSFSNKDSLHLHMDYLVHDFNILKAKKGRLALYYGIGGRAKIEERSRVGVRIPIGINYLFGDAPLDIFFELAPLLDLVPGTEFGLTGGIGIRYYF
jgi:hypothetical protein